MPAAGLSSDPHFADDEGETPGGAGPGAQLGSDTAGPGQPGPRDHYPPAPHLSKGWHPQLGEKTPRIFARGPFPS